jgi:DNA primase
MKQARDLSDAIAQVKARVLLVDEVRRRGVELRGGTRRLEGRCPLGGHQDSTPSFNVYLDTQRYYCFGCHAGGDVLDFVQEMDGCSFLEALERLSGKQMAPPGRATSNGAARLALVPAPGRQQNGADAFPSRAAELAPILTRAMLHYHQSMARAPFVLDYLSSRGVSPAAVRRCLLGYADGSFRLALSGQPGLWRAAREAGLLTARGQEWLSGRLIIPEVEEGRCTWLIGRCLPGPVPRAVSFPDKKYLGLPLDKPLLGFGRAAALCEARPPLPLLGIHVVEGAVDYVITQEWSLPFYNVALLGTHASRTQLPRLLSLHRRSGGLPFLLDLDGDEGGGLGTLHLLEQLSGYPVRALPAIAQGKDLGQLSEHPYGYAWWTHAFFASGEGGEWL